MTLALPVGRLLSPLGPRIAAAFRGREETRARFAEWAARRRADQPLVLVHAPSAGEWRQAEPVVRSLRALRPDLAFALTYTSPSAEAVAGELAPDVHGFLPWDRLTAIRELLDQLRPILVVVTKLDLWPELALEVRRQSIPLILMAATVRPGSSRLKWPARAILRSSYQGLSRALAVAPADAERLERLGVPPERISVAGDPRYDSVLSRMAGLADRADPALLVAGSTWPEDDRVLLPALAQVRKQKPDVRLLLVPHQPSDAGFEQIQRLARGQGLTAQVVTDPRDGSVEPGSGAVVVLNTVGALAGLYRRGTLAYVGGGFGNRGLHSVLEPAAWGRPVIVGPRWRESNDARALFEAGALVTLDQPGIPALGSRWLALLNDAALRTELGKKARAVVERGAGAAERTAAILATSVPPRLRP